MTLYGLTIDMIELINMLNRGEFTEEELKDTIEGIGECWNDKAEAVLGLIKDFRADAEAIRAEEKKLADRRKKKERDADRLERYLAEAMQALEMKRYESARHQVSFRTSHPARITDEAALLEWARENAPEVIKRGEDSISLEAVKTLAKTVNVPYVAIDDVQNIQIG